MADSDTRDPLTPREKGFLRLMREGDMRTAARFLGISPATLRTMGPTFVKRLEARLAGVDRDRRPRQDLSPPPSSTQEPPFPREEELAHLLMVGNYAEAAKRLCISENTVRAKAPYLLEMWERRRPATVEPEASGLSPSHEMAARTESMGENETKTPHTSPARRRVAGKGKPRSLKRYDRD